MSEFVTALTGAGTAMAVGLTAVFRTLPVRSRGRHRAGRVVPLEELLGAPSEYTTPRFTDVPAPGVLTEAWRPCASCGQEMPSVLHRDGWTCGACLTVSSMGGVL